MVTSYTDTNVDTYITSEPAYMTNDSGDIKHNLYDHPVVIHSSKLDTPPNCRIAIIPQLPTS